jgi:hypothetical protein
MSSATLVRDKMSNLKEVRVRKVGKSMEYEFAFPYQNEDPGDSFWQVGKAYQVAILVGPTEEFQGVTNDTWMSDQIYIRLGSPSKESIYYPPYLVQDDKERGYPHSHGAKNEPQSKRR